MIGKLLSLTFIVAAGALAGAQTNFVPASISQDVGVSADGGYFEEKTWELVYHDHVVVTNSRSRLTCERLTIHMPTEGVAGNQVTNAVAETNVNLFILYHGETNHISSDKGTYEYSEVSGVTNQTLTFAGHVLDATPKFSFTCEPLIWDNISSNLILGSNYHMVIVGGTNGAPFSLPK
jgi:lipopolysaccharide export system protein LptA